MQTYLLLLICTNKIQNDYYYANNKAKYLSERSKIVCNRASVKENYFKINIPLKGCTK